MSKNGKRILSALLIVIMCLTSAPISGLIEELGLFNITSLAASTDGTCGKSANWKYDSKTKTLTVYGKGAMYDYDPYNGIEPPYYDREKYPIKNVVVKDGITRIGERAFSYLFEESDVASVKIAESVTSIGRTAFSGAKIKELTLPKKLKKIEAYAFDDCKNLKKVTVPDSVTFIGECAFWGCRSLTEVIIGDGLKELGDVFGSCDKLVKITIGKNVKTVKRDLINNGNEMACIFVDKDNKYLSSDKNGVLFNKDKTRLLMYPGKLKLKTYTIPKTVKAVAECAFYDAPIEKVDASNVEKIGKNVFTNSDIKEVVLGNKLVSINDGAFEFCSKLSKVDLPASVTKLGSRVFMESAAVFVDAANKKYSSDDQGVLFNKAKTTLINYPAKNKSENYTIPDTVTKISSGAFYCNEYITEIKFPKSLSRIEDEAFFNCEKLKSVSLAKNIKYIGESAFSSAYALKKLVIEEGSTAQICENAFNFCENLSNISISSEISEIGRQAFHDTAYVEKQKEISYVGNVLYGVDGDVKILNIKKGTTGIAEEAMYGSSVNSVTIPASVKHIGNNAFMQTFSLHNIAISKDNKCFVVYNGVLFNKDKTRLIKYFASSTAKKYVAPKTVRHVDNYAFCTGCCLENIDISADAENINIYTFMETAMADNFPKGEVIYYKKHAIGYFNNDITPGAIVIKDGTKTVAVSEYCEFPYEAIYIPKSVKEIRSLPTEVYYEGSKEDWNKIKLTGMVSYFIDSSHIHYNFDKDKHTHTYYVGTQSPEKCFSPMLVTYTCPCGKYYTREGEMYDWHLYSGKTKIEKYATLKNDGIKYEICASCGKSFDKTVISRIDSVKLSYTNSKYNGKVKKPIVMVLDNDGGILSEGKDYTVKYPSGRKEVGTYYVTVTFKGDYSGTKKLKFNILPN